MESFIKDDTRKGIKWHKSADDQHTPNIACPINEQAMLCNWNAAYESSAKVLLQAAATTVNNSLQ
jgi:hypothetical protein